MLSFLMMMPTACLFATLLQLASAFDYSILVGKDEVTGLPGVGFAPSYTQTVEAGDHLTFRLIDGEHWVVQSLFESPCVSSGSFVSPLTTVANGTSEDAGPWFTFTVSNSSEPLYFSDLGQNGRNCFQGAVFCANTDESSNKSCNAFKQAALAQGQARGIPTSIRSAPPVSSSTLASAGSISTQNAQNRSNGSDRLTVPALISSTLLGLAILVS